MSSASNLTYYRSKRLYVKYCAKIMGNHCTLDFSLMEISVKRPFLFRSIQLHRGIESRRNPRRVETQVHPLSAQAPGIIFQVSFRRIGC